AMLCSNPITQRVRGRPPSLVTSCNRRCRTHGTARGLRLRMLRWLSLLVAISALSACSMKSQMVHRPTDAGVDAAISAMWVADIRRTARDGDWLLSRAYYATSDLIVLGTRGEALSHGSIYDASRGTVIEAVASGVREIPIEQFVARNHLILVVRPANMTASDGR